MLTLLLCGCSNQESGAAAGAPVQFDYYVNWTLLEDRQLLFRSDIDGDWDIYLADGLTDQLRRVTPPTGTTTVTPIHPPTAARSSTPRMLTGAILTYF